MTRVREWTLALLVAAIAAGAYLRFVALSTSELSADEGASWAAAAVASVAGVLREQARLNPGELGLHDLILHYWMRLFGDGLVVMRSLSALAGVVAIGLVFFVAREVFFLDELASATDNSEERAATAESSDLVAAMATLLFAVNLVTIKYSREARMYPLALAFTLAQLWCFLHSMRNGVLWNLVALAIFTACAIATTFTSVLILVPEGLYLLVMLRRSWTEAFARVGQVGAAILAGLVLLTPAILLYLHNRGGAPNPETWSWISPPVPWDTITLFNKASGTYVFPLLAILAISGAVRSWPTKSGAVLFLILWMIAPPVVLTAISYLLHPAFVERYLLSCFVPFFVLAALGVMELQPAAFRPGALAIVVALALAHVETWARKPHTPQWAEAASIAAQHLKPSDSVGVAPRYASNVVRYYLRDNRPAVITVGYDNRPAPPVLIVANSFSTQNSLRHDYPQIIAKLRDLTVRSR